MKVYVVYIRNCGELLADCPSMEILGVFKTKEKAQEEFNSCIAYNKKMGFKLDLNYKDDTAIMFWKKQENWGCYFEIYIKEKEVL